MFVATLPALTPAQTALFFGLAAIPILPNLWSIWHIFHRDFPSSNEKMAWAMLCIFVPIVGGVIYLIWGRKRGR